MRYSQNRPLKQRVEVVFLVFLALFLALALRLTWIQGIRQSEFARLASRMHVRPIPAPAKRGVVRDRNGRELAANVQAVDITANPKAVEDREGAVQAVYQLVGGDTAFYRRRLMAASHFAYLARGLDREKGLQLEARKIAGLEVRRGPKRIRPGGSLAAHVIGYTNIDGDGLEGVELAMDRHLRGKDGRIVVEVDAAGKPIPDREREEVQPVDGKDVVLTLDATIQQFAEDALARIAAEQKPESATAIVMDTRTGEILAMANLPTYDPNARGTAPVANRRNRAITDLYEPGSTFKLITAAAMLESKTNTSVYCSGGLAVGRRTIRCAKHKVHGREDLVGVIQHSCNIGAGTWGLRLGPERLHQFVQRFGFLEKSGIELRGEAVGSLAKPKKWAPIKTANVAFGQGVLGTPLQVLRAYAAIANDGIMVGPTIVRTIGGVRRAPAVPPQRVLASQDAAKLREALTKAVNEGTGTLTKIANFSVAGKTGTAQLARDGHYVKGAYISSFVGFLPASRPRIGIIVTVTWPKAHHYGGVVAGPAFREIARQTVNYLEIPPDAIGDERDGRDPATFYAWKRNGGAVAQRVAGARMSYTSGSGPSASGDGEKMGTFDE
jgi:stage V sporulation protein D (sporulation-specific penicillin-binding protein)